MTESAQGGIVGKQGDGDTIPALLEPGGVYLMPRHMKFLQKLMKEEPHLFRDLDLDADDPWAKDE